MALESDAAYNQLLKFFKIIYNKNLSPQTYKNANHIIISTKPPKYDKYIAKIKTIFATQNESNNTQLPPLPPLPQPPLTDDDLFSKLYSQIIDYKAKSQTQQAKKIDNDLFYINMHGGFNLQSGVKKIPPNIVVIFLTPVNRYGMACLKDSKIEIDKIFNNKDLKNKILNNILCIDKINDKPKKNNRVIDNMFPFFENALVLLPGQYYYDLDLIFTEKDKEEILNLDIIHYGSTQKQIIPPEQLNYANTLSNIIKKNIPQQDKLTYVIVDCCRNLDHDKQDGTDIYIYENFMLYFNTIMSKCNDEAIKSTNLSQRKFSKFNIVYAVTSNFVKWQDTIEKAFILYLKKKDMKDVIKYIIDKINTTDLKGNIPNNDLLEEFIISNLLTNIKLIYDAVQIQKIKIDKQIIYDFIIKLYNIKQKNNDNYYDRAFNYITDINKIGTDIMNRILEINNKGQTIKIDNFMDDLLNIKDLISFLTDPEYNADTDLELLNTISTYKPLILAQTHLAADYSKIKQFNSDTVIDLTEYLIDWWDLIIIIIKNKYNYLIINLSHILNYELNNMLVSGFVKGKPFNTTSSNKTLGHLGRERLHNATLLLSQQLSGQQSAIVNITGGHRTKQIKRTKRTKRTKNI